MSNQPGYDINTKRAQVKAFVEAQKAAGVVDFRTIDYYAGQLDNLDKITGKFPMCLIWYENENYEKQGQQNYIRRPEFHLIVMVARKGRPKRGLNDIIDYIDALVSPLSDACYELLESPILINEKDLAVAAIKFIW